MTTNQISSTDAFLLGYIFGAAGQSYGYSSEEVGYDEATAESSEAAKIVDMIHTDVAANLWQLSVSAVSSPEENLLWFGFKDVERTSRSIAEIIYDIHTGIVESRNMDSI